MEDILAYDKEHVWHPYTSMLEPLQAYHVESANGTRLKFADGREVIDGMASWWCMVHGYNNEVLNEAAKSQIDKMSHVMFGGLTHTPAVDLAKKLVDLSPEPLEKVFFADSGSVAVEVAIKMAYQYWYSSGNNTKNKLLTVRSGYHGDTFQAMGVCDPDNGMHHVFNGVVSKNIFAPAPKCKFGDVWDESDISEFHSLIEENHSEIAAVILEPIVQGAGGMRFYHPTYLKRVREFCDKYNVLLILDEIATGFGRTGKMFACEHSNISPDIMCVGKALTGGYMTLSATLATKHVAETISKGEAKVFMHGPTFMANPLACAVANASLELLVKSDWQGRVLNIEKQLNLHIQKCATLECVHDVRVLGAIGVVETKTPVDVQEIQKLFVESGVWIRPFGKLVYIMPIFISTNDDIKQLCDAIYDALNKLY